MSDNNHIYGNDPAGEAAYKADQELFKKFREKSKKAEADAAAEEVKPGAASTAPASKPAEPGK